MNYKSCKSWNWLIVSDTSGVYRSCVHLIFGLPPWKKYTIGQSGSSTTITQSCSGSKKSHFTNTAIKIRILKRPFVHARANSLKEPIYSLWYSEGDCCGSHYCFDRKRIIEREHFIYCTQKMIGITGFVRAGMSVRSLSVSLIRSHMKRGGFLCVYVLRIWIKLHNWGWE